MKPPASLDTWRDYFRRGDSDIFGIIEHAIMVAAADSPEEFKSRREAITELLFSRQVSRCIGCDQPDLSKAGDNEANDDGRKTVETDDGGHEEDEMKLNVDQIVDEVMRIKDILLNKHDEDTEIGKAVNLLRRHGSDKISKLAKTLIEKWKEMVDQLIHMPKEVADDDGTPESATLSIADEAEDFPSPPHDLEFYAPEHTGFAISQTYEALITRFDEPRRQPKQTREQMVHTIQRKPSNVAEQKRKFAGSQLDKQKALDQEAKFENAKRRLQESYQQHEKAKRQRTIQVLETIPNQRKTQRPLLKRSVRR
ncbi:hypothetical protein Bca52824_018611 [Brassica carinata]|uniref:TFIIS N-terminal domain-containing protein n=1 Tax=Brassica carinata TaxID=52824 RepID=A0A8X8AWJ7_BRACI|nr:hypothetical protein Bca52824_018611 [Brassica carinata]